VEQRAGIGNTVKRVDGWAKASGAQIYPSDFVLDGMIWVRVLRAAHPHARIVAIDTHKAEQLPGVVRILTAKDVPGLNGFGIVSQDQPVLCQDKVRYLGDAVAAVGAESDDIARQARDLIEVTYEVLPPVTDPYEAMKPDSPKVHEGGNLLEELHFTVGDIEEGFAQADFIVEGEYHTGRQEHTPLETEAGVAYYDENGLLTVRAGGQYPQRDRTQIARALGLRNEDIRVITPMVGGAFGDKDEVTVQIYLALMTYLTGRPGRIMLDRTESIVSSVKRHPFHMKYRTGVTKDGRLIAVEVEIVSDTGAYASLGREILHLGLEHACGPYYVPNTKVDGYIVTTNNGVCGAFRGFGVPQVTLAIESQMDMMAQKIGLDPLRFRQLNALKQGQSAALGNRMDHTVGMAEVLDAVGKTELYRDRERLKALPPEEARWKRRGIGVAATWQGFGLGAGIPDYSVSRITLKEDGAFRLMVGGTDMGQGNTTAFIQMAAHELGCDVDDIELVLGDTELGPDSGPCSASRNVYCIGNSVIRAARDLKAKMLALATTAAEGPLVGEGVFHVPVAEKEIGGGLPHAVFGFGAQVAWVEVDLLTGEITVLKVVDVLDAGKVINWQGILAQSEGGVVQGMGYGLYEDCVIRDGQFVNPSLSTYIIPSILDIPGEIETVVVEVPEPTGPYGAKGIGEIVMTPTAAAIANAVSDAIGIRFHKIPITPEMVLAAIGD